MAVLVSDERLSRAVRRRAGHGRLAAVNPVAAVVVDELATAAGPHGPAVRRAGMTFLDAIGADDPRGTTLGLRTVIAVLAATERSASDPADVLPRLTEGDPLLRMVVAALVRHRPDGAGLRPAGEAREVADLLCKLIYMFRAESEGAELAVTVA